MAHWNTPPITAAERDRAGLAVFELVHALKAIPAALLITDVLFETGDEVEDRGSHADQTINHVMLRVREVIRVQGMSTSSASWTRSRTSSALSRTTRDSPSLTYL